MVMKRVVEIYQSCWNIYNLYDDYVLKQHTSQLIVLIILQNNTYLITLNFTIMS